MNDQTNNPPEEQVPVTDPSAIPDSEMKMPEEETSNDNKLNSSSLGIILGVLIVILVLILAGLYLWGVTLKDNSYQPAPTSSRPTAEENNEPESTNAEAEVETLQAVSTSDEIDAIEADIEATNLDEIEAELNAIDAELDAALEAS